MTKLFFKFYMSQGVGNSSSSTTASSTTSSRCLDVASETLSALELLELMHLFVKEDGLGHASILVGRDGSSDTLTIRTGKHAPVEDTCAMETCAVGSVDGIEMSPKMDASRRAVVDDMTIKKIGHTSTGRHAEVLNEIAVHIHAPVTSTPLPVGDSMVMDTDDSSADAETVYGAPIEWIRETVVSACCTQNGCTVDALVDKITSHPNHAITIYAGNVKNTLESILVGLCKEHVLFEVPHYDSRYQSLPLYITKEYECLYFVQEVRMSTLSETQPVPILKEERVCPWVRYDGFRNQKLYTIFVSRVVTTLHRKPLCNARTIHLDIPMLTRTHLIILLRCMVKERFITQREILNESAVCNIFGDAVTKEGNVFYSL